MKDLTTEDKEIKAADFLHKRSGISTLRTYQGDVADAIKKQNESVASIAMKEKERRDSDPDMQLAKKAKSKRPNSLILVSSLLLILAGSYALFFIYNEFTKKPTTPEIVKVGILSSGNSVVLSNITKENLASELKSIEKSGVTIAEISGIDGKSIDKSVDLLSLLQSSAPSALTRNLAEDYAIGSINQPTNARFLILKFSNFESIFGAMLDWEPYMISDMNKVFGFRGEGVIWVDSIIKNKDVRLLKDAEGEELIAYAFLDKNTVLIASNTKAISEINTLYTSRALVR